MSDPTKQNLSLESGVESAVEDADRQDDSTPEEEDSSVWDRFGSAAWTALKRGVSRSARYRKIHFNVGAGYLDPADHPEVIDTSNPIDLESAFVINDIPEEDRDSYRNWVVTEQDFSSQKQWMAACRADEEVYERAGWLKYLAQPLEMVGDEMTYVGGVFAKGAKALGVVTKVIPKLSKAPHLVKRMIAEGISGAEFVAADALVKTQTQDMRFEDIPENVAWGLGIGSVGVGGLKTVFTKSKLNKAKKTFLNATAENREAAFQNFSRELSDYMYYPTRNRYNSDITMVLKEQPPLPENLESPSKLNEPSYSFEEKQDLINNMSKEEWDKFVAETPKEELLEIVQSRFAPGFSNLSELEQAREAQLGRKLIAGKKKYWNELDFQEARERRINSDYDDRFAGVDLNKYVQKVSVTSPVAKAVYSPYSDLNCMGSTLFGDHLVLKGDKAGKVRLPSIEAEVNYEERKVMGLSKEINKCSRSWLKETGSKNINDFFVAVRALVEDGEILSDNKNVHTVAELIKRQFHTLAEEAKKAEVHGFQNYHKDYVPIGAKRGFFPTYFNKDAILNDLETFNNKVFNHLKDMKGLEYSKIQAASGTEAADNFIMRMTDDVRDHILTENIYEQHIPLDDILRKGEQLSQWKKRVFDIPREEIREFLINDPHYALSKYSKSCRYNIELEKRFRMFGYKGLQDVEHGITLQRDAMLKDVTNPKERDQIIKSAKEAVKELHDLIELSEGRYGTPKSKFDKFIASWAYFGAMHNVVTELGGVATNVISDETHLVNAFGWKKTLQTQFKYFTGLFGKTKAAKKDLENFMGALNHANIKMFNRIELAPPVSSYTGVLGTVDKFGRRLLQATDTLSLGSSINSANELVASRLYGVHLGEKCLAKDYSYLASQKIDKTLADKIAEQFKTHNDKYGFNFSDWDPDVRKEFCVRLLSNTKKLVVTGASRGDNPKWLQKPVGRLLTSYLSYMYHVQNNIILPMLQNKDYSGFCKVFGWGAVTAVLEQYIKDKLAGRERSLTDTVKYGLGRMPVGIPILLYDNVILPVVDVANGKPIFRVQKFANLQDMGAVRPVTKIIKAGFILGKKASHPEKPLSQRDWKILQSNVPANNLFWLGGLFEGLIKSHVKSSGGKLLNDTTKKSKSSKGNPLRNRQGS